MNPYTSSSRYRKEWQRQSRLWRIMLGIALVVFAWAIYLALTSQRIGGTGSTPGGGHAPLELPFPSSR